MNTYVISDIHGCYDDFINMLKKINFSEKDQLVLAGDYIDRGIQNFNMLRWLEHVPDNVLLIKGNHDVEFAQCVNILSSFIKKTNVKISTTEDLLKIYYVIKEDLDSKMFDYYGTIKQLLSDYNVGLSDLIRWMQIIDDMPYYFKIKINKKKHII